MDKDILKEANRLSDIIERLKTLDSSLDSGISYISICANKGSIITAITNSSVHSDIEKLENNIIHAMREAGIKCIKEAIKKKQKELDEL